MKGFDLAESQVLSFKSNSTNIFEKLKLTHYEGCRVENGVEEARDGCFWF